jgi:hypothetical protein
MTSPDWAKDSAYLLRLFDLPDIVPRQGLGAVQEVHQVTVCLFCGTGALSLAIHKNVGTDEGAQQIRAMIALLEVAEEAGQTLVDQFDRELTEYHQRGKEGGFFFRGLYHSHTLAAGLYHARRALAAGRAALAGRCVVAADGMTPSQLDWDRTLLSQAVTWAHGEVLDLDQKRRQARQEVNTIGVALDAVRSEPPIPREMPLSVPDGGSRQDGPRCAVELLPPRRAGDDDIIYEARLFVGGEWKTKLLNHAEYTYLSDLRNAPSFSLTNSELKAKHEKGDPRWTLCHLRAGEDAEDWKAVLSYEPIPGHRRKGKRWSLACIEAATPCSPCSPRSPRGARSLTRSQ